VLQSIAWRESGHTLNEPNDSVVDDVHAMDASAGELDRFAAMVDDLTMMRRCIVCDETYTDVVSVGRLECRRHTGLLQTVDALAYGTSIGTYSCCGLSPHSWHGSYGGRDAARGCVLCDHIDHQGDHDGQCGLPADMRLEYARARILFSADIDERHIRRHENGDVTIIRSTLPAERRRQVS